MNLRYQYHYIKSLLIRYGVRGLVMKTLERGRSPMLSYEKIYRRFLPSEEELKRQRETSFAYAPLVSIVVPAYETPSDYLRGLLDSVVAQSYPNWELCIADGSRTDAVERVAAEYAAKDHRIRWQSLAENGGISGNTNSGFAMAKGDYIALMDHDDLLGANALYEMIRCLNKRFSDDERPYAMIYSDEDKINHDATVHSRPHFKPDFNPEFLNHNNYFCHFLMFSAALLKRTQGLDSQYDGAQDYDFVLRCVDAGAVVRHVPKILYHWRIHEGSTAGNSEDKAYAFDNGCRAIEAHLARCHVTGRADVTPNLGVYHVEYGLSGEYELTVVAGEEAQLARIKDWYGRSYGKKGYRLTLHYQKAELWPGCIEKECGGDYILYIRKDVRTEPKGLVETLLASCSQSQNAVVGARLVTRKGRVASCGYLYGSRGELIPSNGGLPAAYKGYFLHAVIPQNVSVLSFGCVMLKREAFARAGGMAEDLSGIYRDADYCFRVRSLGYRVVVTPYITAVQKEKDVFEEADKARFADRWKEQLAQPDDCYNPNLSLQPGRTYAMRESATAKPQDEQLRE